MFKSVSGGTGLEMNSSGDTQRARERLLNILILRVYCLSISLSIMHNAHNRLMEYHRA